MEYRVEERVSYGKVSYTTYRTDAPLIDVDKKYEDLMKYFETKMRVSRQEHPVFSKGSLFAMTKKWKSMSTKVWGIVQSWPGDYIFRQKKIKVASFELWGKKPNKKTRDNSRLY